MNFKKPAIKSFLLVALFVASLFVALPLHSFYRKFTEPGWRKTAIRNDVIWVDPYTARLIATIENASGRCLARGDTVLAAPVWPGIYALLGVRAPVWDIYPTVSRSGSFEDAEVVRLKKAAPVLVFIDPAPLDGRINLLYRNTHPRIWKFIIDNYNPVNYSNDALIVRSFVRKSARCKLLPRI